MTLPRQTGSQDDCFYETLGLGPKESPFHCACDSYSSRCDRVSHHRAACANARGLLGRNRDFGCDAIHSRRNLDPLDRADRRYRSRRISWSARSQLFQDKSGRVRGCDLSGRIAVVRVSFGENRISLREHHAHYHCSDSTLGSVVGDRFAQIH